MADVFISYAAEDRETAGRLAEHLENAGLSVWWDRRLLPGSRFSRLIQRELGEADWVIVLWSPNSVESEWVEIEAAYARQHGKLVPALIADVASQVPLEFSRLHTADLIGWKGEGSHPELLSVLEVMNAPGPSPRRAVGGLTPSAKKGAERLLAAAHEAFERREFTEASNLLESALPSGVPQNRLAEAHALLGNAYYEVGRYDDAIAAHECALGVDRDSSQAWVDLGRAHRLNGDLEEAERCYRKALGLAPDFGPAHASLGAIYIFKGQTELAVETLRHATALDPQNAVAHANLALAFGGAGEFDRADAALRRAITLGYRNGAVIRERLDSLRM